MYELKGEIKKQLESLDHFRKEVEAGKVLGFMLLHYNAEQKAHVEYNCGDISPFEWLGLLEYAKDAMLGVISEEDEDDEED